MKVISGIATHRKTLALGVAATLMAVSWASPALAAIPQEGFADLVEQVEPSVVTIEVSKKTSVQPTQFGGDPRANEFFQRFFGAPGQGPAEAQPVRGAGSGFIIDADGFVVTNYHVVEGAEEVTVHLVDGREYEATIVGQDDKTDLAVLKIDAPDLDIAQFGDSDDTRVGDWVVAIGNPFGLGGTATAGIVSARGRDLRSGPYDDYLQIDAPVNRGNSGGPVFNTDGEVVGVNTAIISPNGGSVGIGFAIPSNQVDEIVAELKRDGVVERGWLGVSLQDLDEELASSLGLEASAGALVTEVTGDSPAAKGGIEIGDVIIEFDGSAVENGKYLARRVGAADPGDKVAIRVHRGDDLVTLKVRLGSPSNAVAANTAEQAIESLGMSLVPLDDELRAELGVDENLSGVVVTRVEPGSAAAEVGVRRGDILVSVDRQTVRSAKDLGDVLAGAKADGRESVAALVKRGAGQRYAVLPVA